MVSFSSCVQRGAFTCFRLYKYQIPIKSGSVTAQVTFGEDTDKKYVTSQCQLKYHFVLQTFPLSCLMRGPIVDVRARAEHEPLRKTAISSICAVLRDLSVTVETSSDKSASTVKLLGQLMEIKAPAVQNAAKPSLSSAPASSNAPKQPGSQSVAQNKAASVATKPASSSSIAPATAVSKPGATSQQQAKTAPAQPVPPTAPPTATKKGTAGALQSTKPAATISKSVLNSFSTSLQTGLTPAPNLSSLSDCLFVLRPVCCEKPWAWAKDN